MTIPKGTRKLLIGILVMAVGVLVDMTATKGLTDNLLDLLKYIAIAFFAGNSAEHMAESIKTRLTTASIDAKLKKMTDSVKKLDVNVKQVADANVQTQQGISVLINAEQTRQGQR